MGGISEMNNDVPGALWVLTVLLALVAGFAGVVFVLAAAIKWVIS